MEETEIDEYNLDSNERQQFLRISLINNQQISIILTNKETKQKFSALISLSQLKDISAAFISSRTISDALTILKSTIESGNIILIEDPKESVIELKFNINLESGEYPPFHINLNLQENSSQIRETEGEASEIPEPFEYIGNEESPRPSEINVQNQNFIEDPIKKFNKAKDYPNFFRANSVERSTNTSLYSSQTMLHNENNSIKKIAQNNKYVRSAIDDTQDNLPIYNSKTTFNLNNNNFYNNILNKANSDNINYVQNPALQNKTYLFKNSNIFNDLNKPNFHNIVERRPRMINKANSDQKDINRSSSTPSHETFNQVEYLGEPNPTFNPYQINQYSSETLVNNNKTHPYSRNTSNYYNQNILNPSLATYQNYTYKPNHNFNINNLDQIRQAQHTQIEDRLTLIQKQKQKVQEAMQQLAKIQQHQQVFQDQQKQLTFQQQQKEMQRMKNNPVNIINEESDRQNSKEFAQVQLINKQRIQLSPQESQTDPNPSPQKKINLINRKLTSPNSQNEEQQMMQKNSQEISPFKSKTKMLSSSNNSKNKKKSSSPESIQTHILKRDISKEQIAFAEMASLKNMEDPNLQNMEAMVLPNINQEAPEKTIENEEIENSEIQQEYNQKEEPSQSEQNEEKSEIVGQKQEKIQEKVENQVEEQEQIEDENQYQEEAQEEEQPPEEEGLNIEALFITEEGRVIFRNGLLRGIIHKYAEIDNVVSRIQDILLKGVKFHLVYKAFDLDDKAETFHEKCDKLDMSLVLVETADDIRFGGFTTKSWEGNCEKKEDPNAFVFSLETDKIFEIIENMPAIGCYPKFGPVFFGCQIRIFDEFFKNGGTTCHKGLNYNTTIDYELNNGEQKYLIKDIEVYSLETIDIE